MAGLGMALAYMAGGAAEGVGASLVEQAKARREAALRELELKDARKYSTEERIAGQDFELDKAKELHKMDLETVGAKNAADTYRILTPEEKVQMGLDPASPFQVDGNNKISKIGGDGTTVNIDQRADGAFKKKIAEKQAETFDTISTEGMGANADLGVIDEVEGLLSGQGGSLTGIAGKLASYGIGGEGMSDIQAAQALIAKLVPTQRQPGSGTMSDRDVELFKSSLPSLWNTPEGNTKILGVMRGLAQYKRAQGEIADRVITEEITPQEGRAALMALPNPLAEFSKPKDGASGKAGTDDVIDYKDFFARKPSSSSSTTGSW